MTIIIDNFLFIVLVSTTKDEVKGGRFLNLVNQVNLNSHF